MNLRAKVERLAQAIEAQRLKAIEGMTDEELQALIDSGPPDERAAMDALTDGELREMADGRIPARWPRLLEAARRGEL